MGPRQNVIRLAGQFRHVNSDRLLCIKRTLVYLLHVTDSMVVYRLDHVLAISAFVLQSCQVCGIDFIISLQYENVNFKPLMSYSQSYINPFQIEISITLKTYGNSWHFIKFWCSYFAPVRLCPLLCANHSKPVFKGPHKHKHIYQRTHAHAHTCAINIIILVRKIYIYTYMISHQKNWIHGECHSPKQSLTSSSSRMNCSISKLNQPLFKNLNSSWYWLC